MRQVALSHVCSLVFAIDSFYGVPTLILGSLSSERNVRATVG